MPFIVSGILFPEDRSETARSEVENSEDEDDEENSGFNDDPDIDEEDSLSINQMYPNTMGLTCCLGSGIRGDNDIKIILSGRYYEKIERKGIGTRFGLLLEQDRKEFERLLAELEESRTPQIQFEHPANRTKYHPHIELIDY